MPQDLRVTVVRQANKEREEHQEQMEVLDPWDPLEGLVKEDRLEPKELQVPRDFQVPMEPPEHLERLETQAHVDRRERQVPKDKRASEDLTGNRELQVRKYPCSLRNCLYQVSSTARHSLIINNQQEMPEHLASRARREIQVVLDSLDLQVSKAPEELKDNRVLKVSKEHLETQETSGLQDQQVKEVVLETQELQDYQELMDYLDLLDPVVKQDLQAHEETRDLLACPVRADHKETQERLELRDNQEAKVYLVFQETMELVVRQVRPDPEDLKARLDPPVLTGH